MIKRTSIGFGLLLLAGGLFLEFGEFMPASIANAFAAFKAGNPQPSFPAGVGELKVTIKEWDVPTKGAHPHDPAVGGDGAL